MRVQQARVKPKQIYCGSLIMNKTINQGDPLGTKRNQKSTDTVERKWRKKQTEPASWKTTVVNMKDGIPITQKISSQAAVRRTQSDGSTAL